MVEPLIGAGTPWKGGGGGGVAKNKKLQENDFVPSFLTYLFYKRNFFYQSLQNYISLIVTELFFPN